MTLAVALRVLSPTVLTANPQIANPAQVDASPPAEAESISTFILLTFQPCIDPPLPYHADTNL